MPSKKPGEYEAYMFDWDGTLAKTLDLHIAIRRKVMEKHGAPISYEEAVASLGKLDKALEEWGMDVKVVGGEMDELVTKELPYVELYPGVADMLKRLKDAGKKTALITASWHSFIADVLERNNLREYFDVVIAAEDIKHLKPNPEGLLKAMEALHVSPSEALMLGDGDKDMMGAKNAGVDSLLFYPDSHKLIYDQAYQDSLGAKYTISSWGQLHSLA